jgi:FtsZ-interacting cell division protein YlmF
MDSDEEDEGEQEQEQQQEQKPAQSPPQKSRPQVKAQPQAQPQVQAPSRVHAKVTPAVDDRSMDSIDSDSSEVSPVPIPPKTNKKHRISSLPTSQIDYNTWILREQHYQIRITELEK